MGDFSNYSTNTAIPYSPSVCGVYPYTGARIDPITVYDSKDNLSVMNEICRCDKEVMVKVSENKKGEYNMKKSVLSDEEIAINDKKKENLSILKKQINTKIANCLPQLQIKSIKMLNSDKLVINFANGITQTAKRSSCDDFDLDTAIMVCIAKQICGGKKDLFKAINLIGRFMELSNKEEQLEENIKQQIKDRNIRNAKRREKKAAKRREQRIQEQTEAYIRAMKIMEAK